MTERSFPISPRSSRDLEVGDIVAVPAEHGSWACLVVLELRRSGVGSRTTFVVGSVAWRGDHPPTEPEIAGLSIIAQGMTRIELFTDGGVQVVGNVERFSDVPPSVAGDSNYVDTYVGARHQVWGWKTALRYAKRALT